MPDLAQPAPMSFIIGTIFVIFVIIGLGIAAVQRGKKAKEES